ncbi:MAG TPA: TIGR02757 family protein [Chitinophagales bacterium]|nr:TIGR02757 family protein [Chitinophagales bacterium]
MQKHLTRRTSRTKSQQSLADHLDGLVVKYNNPDFIKGDPISLPHKFTKLQDREIIGFWTAMLSWGQRKTIINKAEELLLLMHNSPYDFILHHKEDDLKRFADFKHRTFNYTDTLWFIYFLRSFYAEHNSLEEAFLCEGFREEVHVEKMLIHFHNLFFSDRDAPQRTKKHIPTPASKSACKRLNMFLRWMVRKDNAGVDFGCWQQIQPSQLICPLDVHVERVARKLGLLTRKQTDWDAAIELTENLRMFDHSDPVKYDYALFGSGVMEKHVLDSEKKAIINIHGRK